ncbi:OLC1v1031186C2 [Oldenlandia corymbosa var. corymbosa]|uniref:OLC1v1031186C2 n=1 Tax=Oldenlandia corymbosa var. corymbosa TaxID=529605 RepID=A0AAV1CL96_OLDCO|nr:OLC1v1031186C2 [Oldenlandia corymbosa var. corymbosa]
MSSASTSSVFISSSNAITTQTHNHHLTNVLNLSFPRPKLVAARCFCGFTPRSSSPTLFKKLNRVFCSTLPSVSTNTTHYEFSDGGSEVELRLKLGDVDITSRDVIVDPKDDSLAIKVQLDGSLRTLMETSVLYEKIKPAETIWYLHSIKLVAEVTLMQCSIECSLTLTCRYLDDDELVVNLKKQDGELYWPDIVESWESLTVGVTQLLKGTSVYLVGESTEINQKISRELAVGLGYTPLDTKELMEAFTKQTIDSWESTQGSDAVAEVESAILENLSCHARTVVATVGGRHGAASRTDNWRHLFAGFTVWLSQSEATDEVSARDEAKRHFQDGTRGYSNAEVVVKLGGWDTNYSKTVAQATLSALKRLILSDKELPGKKSLYVRLGCRGDWPDIKPPGYDPSTANDA